MKFILISLIIVILINVTRAKNLLDIFLEYRNINRDVSKASRPPSYVIARRRSIGLFPSLPNIHKKFMVDLKPSKETHSPVSMSEQYKQHLMRELSMKDEYKDIDKMKTEVTTRRSLMLTKKFTVRPHDVHAESVREKYNWNRNRKNIKSRKPKSEKNISKTNYKIIEDVEPVKRKSKTTLLFPKRNNTKYFKGNLEKNGFKRLQIKNFVPKNKVSLNIENNSNNIIREKENIIVPSKFTKSDCKDQVKEIIKPKDFFDEDELIPVKVTDKVNDISFVEPDNEEITTDSDIELDSRHRRSVIEEESVATTFSGIRITNQDYPISNDLTFNNIHT